MLLELKKLIFPNAYAYKVIKDANNQQVWIIDETNRQKLFQIKNIEGKACLFDVVRKKYVVLQPEEWVRQHCIHYLINILHFSKSLLAVEKEIVLDGQKRRYDILAGTPEQKLLVVECKSFKVKLNKEAAQQAAAYNKNLQVPYMYITNGLEHYYFQRKDTHTNFYTPINELPDFKDSFNQ